LADAQSKAFKVGLVCVCVCVCVFVVKRAVTSNSQFLSALYPHNSVKACGSMSVDRPFFTKHNGSGGLVGSSKQAGATKASG